MPDLVVPLDADRLDAIQAAAQEANGDGVTWKLADPERPDGHEVLVDYDNGDEGASVLHDRYLLRADAVHIATADPPTVLALVAAAREAIALRAEVERLRGEVYAVREGAAEFRQAITEALPENPNDLLTPEQHAELNEALGRIAATRNPCWGQRPPTDGGPDA